MGESRTSCLESVMNGVYLEKQVDVSNCSPRLGNRDHEICHNLKETNPRGLTLGSRVLINSPLESARQ